MLREMELLAETDRAGMPSPSPGPIFSFVPAAASADASALVRELVRTGRPYSLACADLTSDCEAQALEMLHISDAVFLVVTPDAAALHAARDKMAWLARHNLAERTGVIVMRTVPGFSVVDIEEVLEAPVCSVIDSVDTPTQVARLAYWLGDGTE